MSKKLIVCSDCDGYGIIYWDECVDHHKGDYATRSKDCKRCKNRGVLMEITSVTRRPLTEDEYKPSKTHNPKSVKRYGY